MPICNRFHVRRANIGEITVPDRQWVRQTNETVAYCHFVATGGATALLHFGLSENFILVENFFVYKCKILT